MNWKKKFRELILERGRTYFRRNRVYDLTYENLIYRARVLGETAYDVEIKIREDDIVYMKCSCPYAASGQYCKHMAAVMYAIEERGEELKQEQLPMQEKKMRPFEISKDTYQYFDMGRITQDLEFSEKLYEEAVQLVQEKKIVLKEVSVGYARFINHVSLCGVARGSYQDYGAARQIEIMFCREGLIRAKCEVRGCGGRYENAQYYTTKVICKHMLALMLLLDEYLKKYNPGDSTDEDGNMLVNAFRNLHYKEVMEKQQEEVNDFVVEPVLERNGNTLAVSFKVYVVKNLTEFVNLYEDKDIVRFGTKTEIDLAKHRIQELSKPTFEYMRHIINEEQNRIENSRRSYNYYYSSEGNKNQIELYGERLDGFYDLCEGKIVSCNDRSSGRTVKTTLRFFEGKPKIKLKIEKNVDEEGIFHGVTVSGHVPDFVKGNQYYYCFSKSGMCRISDGAIKEIEPLLELGEYGQFSFNV